MFNDLLFKWDFTFNMFNDLLAASGAIQEILHYTHNDSNPLLLFYLLFYFQEISITGG
jgi:hypothetical protein